eukprot:1149153-Pelagomonas_calceolata.AAC.3
MSGVFAAWRASASAPSFPRAPWIECNCVILLFKSVRGPLCCLKVCPRYDGARVIDVFQDKGFISTQCSTHHVHHNSHHHSAPEM